MFLIRIILFNLMLFLSLKAQSQFELTTGYAVNKNLADGAPVQVGYDFKVKQLFFTKTQIGFKYLQHFNDYVGARIKVSIWELHQTFSYELIKNRKYIFKPNIGINYRGYYWRGQIEPPYNVLPQRVYKIEFRDDRLRLNSFDNGYKDNYKTNNLGFSIQLQNQFKVNNKLWFHVTPFIEPDYDGTQNTGGCYIGVIFKQE